MICPDPVEDQEEEALAEARVEAASEEAEAAALAEGREVDSVDRTARIARPSIIALIFTVAGITVPITATAAGAWAVSSAH